LASDFAAMIRAALALNEATGEGRYLEQALAWQRALDRHYSDDESGGYFLTADDAQGLVVRPNATSDDATPNPIALTAQNLIRLAVLAGDDGWRGAADKLFDRLLRRAASNLVSHATLLNALDLRLRSAEIVVTGREGVDSFISAALTLPFTNRILLRAGNAEGLPPNHPARAKIGASGTASAVFLCVGEQCTLPLREAEELRMRFAEMVG
jgi:uncharacterized protein YyaL (SSP411 family)